MEFEVRPTPYCNSHQEGRRRHFYRLGPRDAPDTITSLILIPQFCEDESYAAKWPTECLLASGPEIRIILRLNLDA